ncbi:MAG: putative signal transducing protein, partial [Rudaea sp.]
GVWIEVEVCELLQRFFKPNAERLRPSDRMVAHTGYLIFARAVAERVAPVRTRRERKYLQRQVAGAEGEQEQSEPAPIGHEQRLEDEQVTGESEMNEPKLVVVYKAAGEMQAQIVKGRLTSEGIPAIFQNEALGTLGFTVDGLGEFRILVPADREKDALAILADTAEVRPPAETESEDDKSLPNASPSPSF